MRLIAPVLVSILALTGCQSSPGGSATPGSSGSATSAVLPPVMLDPNVETHAFLPMGQTLVLTVTDPGNWSAKVLDPSIVKFIKGGNQGSWDANPSFTPLKPATTLVTLTDPQGKEIQISIEVVDGADFPDLVPTKETVALSQQVIGLKEEDAVVIIKGSGCNVRIARRDKEEFVLTADYSARRINLEIDGDVVTKATIG